MSWQFNSFNSFNAFNPFISLLFPPNCLVCNLPGTKLCSVCGLPWNLPITKVQIEQKIPLFYQVQYGEKINPLILAAKENNDRFAQTLISSCILKSINLLRQNNSFEKFFLVPIPSRKSNERQRGYSHIKKILEFVASSAFAIEFLPLLQIIKPIDDQTSLGAELRILNMKGAYRCDKKILRIITSKMDFSHYRFVIVDDLVTTGASIREAIRALKSEKIPVSAVICAAATLRHNRLTYEAYPRNKLE